MTALSSLAERKILDHLFKNTSYTSPNAYIGLFSTDPTDSASGTELSGNGYARIQMDNKMSAATTGDETSSITNSSQISFAAATGDWDTITHIGIFDAISSGNLLSHGALVSSAEVDASDVFAIQIGKLVITID